MMYLTIHSLSDTAFITRQHWSWSQEHHHSTEVSVYKSGKDMCSEQVTMIFY